MMEEKNIIPGNVIEKSPKNSGLGRASNAIPSLISPGKCSKTVTDPGFRVGYFVFPGLWECTSDRAKTICGTLLYVYGVHAPVLFPHPRAMELASPPPGCKLFFSDPLSPTLARSSQAEVDGSPRYEEAVTCCHSTSEQQNH